MNRHWNYSLKKYEFHKNLGQDLEHIEQSPPPPPNSNSTYNNTHVYVNTN